MTLRGFVAIGGTVLLLGIAFRVGAQDRNDIMRPLHSLKALLPAVTGWDFERRESDARHILQRGRILPAEVQYSGNQNNVTITITSHTIIDGYDANTPKQQHMYTMSRTVVSRAQLLDLDPRIGVERAELIDGAVAAYQMLVSCASSPCWSVTISQQVRWHVPRRNPEENDKEQERVKSQGVPVRAQQDAERAARMISEAIKLARHQTNKQ